MKICVRCDKEIEDDSWECPYCDSEILDSNT